MMSTRPRIVALLLGAMLALSGSYLYAQFGQDFFEGFGGLRGEQGDLAERPPDPTVPDGAPIIPGASGIC
jgi:hypothetical protein